MPIDTEIHGRVTLRRERPPSTLAAHAEAIAQVLGKDLPADVAAFYARCDGIEYAASCEGTSLGLDETLCGLERMFADFKPHRQLKSQDDFSEFAAGAMYDAPHCGDIWSEDFSVDEKGDLARFNQMLRSKLLVSVAGQPDALVIDFAPRAKKGVTKPYEILLVHDGHDVLPMSLDFPLFVTLFERFGSAGWPYAFIGEKGAEVLNIDLAQAIESALALLGEDFAPEISALVARMQK